MPGIPDLSAVPDPLRILVAIGLTGLLVILRFDAERFSAAEYDDVDRWGRPPSLFRRLAWYTIGLGLILLVSTAHPSAASDLYQGLGERLGAVILGFVLLHERPKPNQWVGIVCTIAGVSLLAAVV